MILYHESFIDKSILSDEAAQKRKELTDYAQRENKYLVYFSGGSDTRLLERNIAHVPDFILYQNLHVFLNAYKNNDLNLNYLLFGSDPKLEEKLKVRQLELIQETEKEEIKEVKGKQNLFLRPLDDFISNPIINSDNETLWEASDDYLNEFIEENLNEKPYDNIFIPLCFGDTLSDFNGLKLAIYLRCCNTINQCSNIYIYGFVGFSSLVNHSYFDVLKTKNVELIDFSKKSIHQSAILFKNKIQENELSKEISKIKLSPPKKYFDSHSVANEWAIYRWSKTINVSAEKIEGIENKIESNLYFKYLKTIYPINNANVISGDKLKINYSGDPKVLYIDDEAEKGWEEIFAEFFGDKNNIYFDYLIEDFKNLTQDQLIKSSLQKIKEDDIDLVLLDFRLLPSDFITKNLEEVTGVKLLKEIKELNSGIQVIIFSATNKIWNLQKLQDAGADGFILKESPENSSDINFTSRSVIRMIELIEDSLRKSFLKRIYDRLKPLLKLVDSSIKKKPKNYNLNIQQTYLIKYQDYLVSADYILRKSTDELKFSFLQLVLIVEDIIKTFYISDSIGDHAVEVSLYEKVKCVTFQNESLVLSLKPKGGNNFSEFSHENMVLDKDLGKKNYLMFNNKSDRIPFNYRLHCVLYFKYELSLEECSAFSNLYRLRSSSVAHMGDNKVEFIDLEKVIKLLDILIS
ncbi:response regulator [Polaribacter sp. Hel_I_88]|uniref:response regulator n=1 Tax=Polaribacter sp. Hel_I_88 TaxID=1250006 RepID=UPI0018CC4EA7|nr:response regulator [Polaribacter sp. Hel_I_88]